MWRNPTLTIIGAVVYRQRRRTIGHYVCLFTQGSPRSERETGRVVVSGARRHVIMMFIVSTSFCLTPPCLGDTPLKDVMKAVAT